MTPTLCDFFALSRPMLMLFTLTTIMFGSGCVGISPKDLRVPEKMTCINLPTAISYNAKRGLLDIAWETRLERGPYISEREDDEGTYYRAPPGGVFLGLADTMHRPGSNISHMTHDGGFWLPKNPNTGVPRIYTYFSLSSAPTQPPPDNVNCSSFGYMRDPQTSGISIIGLAIDGVGVGVNMVPGSGMSYGQAVTGGVIGMIIVGAIVNSEVGKIVPSFPINDDKFMATLKALSDNVVPLKEIQKQPLVSK